MNSVILIGNLTRDAELKYTAQGSAITKMSIAVNKRVKKNEEWVDEAHFFDLVQWGKRGESLAQYLTKGKKIAVAGELEQQRWTDKEGKTKSKIVVNVQEIELLSAHEKSEQATQPKTNREKMAESGEFTDDIPFN